MTRPFSLVVMTPDFYPGDRGSRPALAGCFYLQVYISPPTTFGAWCQDDYRQSQKVKQCLRSQKRALKFLKRLSQMFHCGMEECGSASAKYIVYSVYRFIGCIIDQCNWSGPFSLVVMTPDFYPGDWGSRPALAGCFYLQV